MALLGLQLVFSMIMASVLSKLLPHYSLARNVLCSRLVRYLHPSEEEMRSLSGLSNNLPKGKGKKDKRDGKRKDDTPVTTYSKNLNIQLDSAPIKAMDLLPLQYYPEYHWLVDFAFCGILHYTITEIYYAVLKPTTETNLSMMWCLLVIGFALKILYSLTAIYFRTEESGERMMCIVFGFFFLVLAMGVLIVDEETLEFGLEPAYFNFSTGANSFLEEQGINSAGPISIVGFKIILAIICAILGAFLTFPGLRLAKMHSDALKYTDSGIMQLLLHLNMIMPLIITLMWVKPMVRIYLLKAGAHSGRIILTGEGFESIRLLIIIGFCVLRLVLVWPHLQAHLNMACERIEKMKKEAGRATLLDVQKIVVNVFYYLCVVALQYLAPVILLLFSAFMLKTMGNLTFSSIFNINTMTEHDDLSKSVPTTQTSDAADDTLAAIQETAAQFSLALSSLKQVFTSTFFRGLFSFICWWICCTSFTTSAFGLLYYSYFQT